MGQVPIFDVVSQYGPKKKCPSEDNEETGESHSQNTWEKPTRSELMCKTMIPFLDVTYPTSEVFPTRVTEMEPSPVFLTRIVLAP